MKLKHAAVLAAATFLAACGDSGNQEGDVRFLGFAPVTAGQKDLRSVSTHCPGCGAQLAVDTKRCPNKKCKTDMNWSGSGGSVYGKDYRCPSCQGTGVCPACSVMEQGKGECYNCKGLGVLIYAGQSPVCPNCKGNKVCPICKGNRKCDYCSGEGKLSKEIIKTRAAVKDDSGLPESDPRPADPKKDDAEKKPETKEEPKKDGGAKEDKK
jgi:hypothetical protein